MFTTAATPVPATRPATAPVQVALLASPYPDGLLLAQSLRVLSGGQVNWLACPDAFWRSLQRQDGPAPSDLLICDHAACGADAAAYCQAIASLGLASRLILLADSSARQAAVSCRHTYPAGMLWLMRPWRLDDLGPLLNLEPRHTATA